MVGRFAIKHRVSVWGKEHEITVHQKSKSGWEAVGNYMGETITRKRLVETGCRDREPSRQGKPPITSQSSWPN